MCLPVDVRWWTILYMACRTWQRCNCDLLNPLIARSTWRKHKSLASRLSPSVVWLLLNYTVQSDNVACVVTFILASHEQEANAAEHRFRWIVEATNMRGGCRQNKRSSTRNKILSGFIWTRRCIVAHTGLWQGGGVWESMQGFRDLTKSEWGLGVEV